jgi:hypothetical protein
MSNETNEDAQKSNVEVDYPEPGHVHNDMVLQMIVAEANAGISSAVTLVMGGTVIGGFVISAEEYYTRMWKQADKWIAQARNEAPEGEYALHYRRMAEESAEHHANWERDPHYLRRIEFICLSDARMLLPNGEFAPSLNGDGLLWRGCLREVGGFSIGIFHEAQPIPWITNKNKD